jgi:hypothetical protein
MFCYALLLSCGVAGFRLPAVVARTSLLTFRATNDNISLP